TRGFNRKEPRAAQPQPIEKGEDYHGGHGGHGEKEWFYSPSSVVAPRSLSPCPFRIKSSVPSVASVVMALRPRLWLRRSGSPEVNNPRSRRGKPRTERRSSNRILPLLHRMEDVLRRLRPVLAG